MLSPTVPNPTQFNFSAGTVASSSQVNSNFYGLETQIFALIGGLNGCAWIPGATIGSVSATAPIIAALGTCAPNTGTGVNLALSLSSTLPATTFSGAITANGGVTSAGQTSISGAPAVLVNYGAGGASGLSVYNGTTGTLGPISGSAGNFSGAVASNGGNVAPMFTIAGSAVGTNAHIVVGAVAAAPGNNPIGLSGSAVYSGLNTYACSTTNSTVSATAMVTFETTGSLFYIANPGAAQNVAFMCTGY